MVAVPFFVGVMFGNICRSGGIFIKCAAFFVLNIVALVGSLFRWVAIIFQ